MIKLYNEDCLNVIKDIPDKSIDLIVTDPPYKLTARGTSGTMGGYWKNEKAKKGVIFDNNNIEFKDYFDQLYRVLKDGSILYIMCNNKNLKKLLNIGEGSGFKFIKNLIWEKGNKICGKYYMGCYEYITLFRKGKDKPINNCGTPDILKIPIKKLKDQNNRNLHDTEKPTELMKILIENSSKENDTVLDLFMGLGSTGVACKETKRNFIGIEIDEKYFNIAKERIEKKDQDIQTTIEDFINE